MSLLRIRRDISPHVYLRDGTWLLLKWNAHCYPSVKVRNALRKSLKIYSLNIHKGFSGGIRRFTLPSLRAAVSKLNPDVLFLQEVSGSNSVHSKYVAGYPVCPQFEYLAEELWPYFSYGMNVVYSHGHHGNAILSRFPILSSENFDVSQNRIERRGILHATIGIPGFPEPVHALCAHLGLLGWHRKRQLDSLASRIENHVPANSPLIAAGDFNDWRKHATSLLEKRLQLNEAFIAAEGAHASTFPSWLPLLCLDRIYFRGFNVLEARRLDEQFSDHLALSCELERSGA